MSERTKPERCATCKFWVPTEYDNRRESYEPQEEGSWGFCVLIGDYDRFDESAERPGRDLTSPRAFTRDGSDYWSALLTRSDFGCVDHEAAPAHGR